jgi:hypothetical protein
MVKAREREVEQTRRTIRQPGERRPGGDAFEESIEKAPENLRPKLNELHTWAASLESDGLVELTSYLGKDTTLQLRVPGKSSLISAYNQPDRNTASIVFWTNNLKEHAPKTTPVLDESVGTNILVTANTTVQRTLGGLSENLWGILRDAYREANGLLVDDGDIAEQPT